MLELWQTAGVLRPLDAHLARRLGALGGETRPEVLLAVALASRSLEAGHVCLPLAEPGWAMAGHEGPLPVVPEATAWAELLRTSPLVAEAGAGVGGAGDGVGAGAGVAGEAGADRPLVLDGHRLYLRRYFEYERTLAASIRARLAQAPPIDEAVLREGVARLFPPNGGAVDWQRVAALAAVTRRFAAISGGPGTGKTYTVTKILALLIEQARAHERAPPRILLLAPTGKAAHRLLESIDAARAGLACDAEIRDAFPRTPSTIHRALGASLDGVRFQRDASRRLEADVVLVDEASMVDLGLMYRLVTALPDDAHLILLGDRDQLASVEAGAVLGDICAEGGATRHSRAFAERVARVTGDALPVAPAAPASEGLWDAVVTLERSRRYGEASGIGRLARAVRDGDAAATLAVLAAGGDVERLDPGPGGTLPDAIAALAHDRYAPLLDLSDPATAHAILASFRLLCAHRRGPAGVEDVNATLAARLHGARGAGGMELPGTPILITRNDPEAELSNGDVGVFLPVIRAAAEGRAGSSGPPPLAAMFPRGDGFRGVPSSMLPEHEVVYAMSIHKSQGSELSHVVVVLPEKVSPVVTRELLYTAITRARDRVTVVASEAVVHAACTTPVRRASGLAGALWRR